ncbi:Aldo-keto reductase [Alternaria arborescens]|uniref:Aldo-keto reductase n=1 Tax=Alternaria arborescens TaxID=156630 RepID=A0A4Q4RK15_9PLEO|nr:Aldo-keto reductase [Alternaria arborescens]RYN43345.1 Aldo-keto reductase [Alternaria arborescens]RYO28462.1 Aldo-keto reductase [Alternaria arborescens]RYO56916.1 Aldo-keto reductase [Alternaria arborescens]
MPDKLDVQGLLQESKAEYKRLGKSGLKVSVPILGAMSIGSSKWQPWVIEEEESLPLLKAAYDRGLTTWDTANVYSNGVSEELVGKAIKKYDLPREKLVILTKCFGYVGEDPGLRTIQYGTELPQLKDYVNQGGLSRQAIFNAVNASLKRLDLEYIDLLQIHRYDPNTPLEETMEALHDLVKSGKVRYIGASSMWAVQFAQMQFTAEKNGWTKFVSMQNHYNLLYREEEREMNRFCNDTGVGLIPWAPLCRGHLARPPSAFGSTTRSEGEQKAGNQTSGNNERDKKIIGRVEEIAKKHDWKMSHVALAWINKRVASPIIGFSSVDRMDEALAARGKELTEEEEKYLEELYEPVRIVGHS